MAELTQAQLAKEPEFWPATAKGLTWTWQRCGRYEYRKCLTHSTNPDYPISRELSPTVGSPLRIAARSATERSSPSPLFNAGLTEDADG